LFYVLTVHFHRNVWVDVQLRYLRKHLPEDTAIWGCLNGIDRSLWSAFDFADDFGGTHAEKLNRLAKMVSEKAKPDDYLVFIDGDAFPIARVDENVLAGKPLAAVRRDENMGDPQPHPCFCVTTVGFWNRIKGDWRGGYRWTNQYGYSVTDVGGNLLKALRRANEPWTPLLRSNTVNPHPVFYAVYGDVVYHHGAGFRDKITRTDLLVRPARVPAWVPVLRDWERERVFRRAYLATKAQGEDGKFPEAPQSREILDSIIEDEEFYKRFLT
jgi:hypothetical protein